MKRYLILLILFLLSSCAMNSSLDLNEDLSGRVNNSINVAPSFNSIISDAATLSENKGTGSFAKDMSEQFKTYFKDSQNVTNLKTEVSSENSFQGSFDFTNLEKIFIDLAKENNQNVLKADKNGISILISRENYSDVENMITFLKDPGFETFGPIYNEGVSKEEYYDMMSYILGDNGPSDIQKSKIEIQVKSEKKIKSIENGKLIGDYNALFTIDLIDFLLLEKPLSFKINY